MTFFLRNQHVEYVLKRSDEDHSLPRGARIAHKLCRMVTTRGGKETTPTRPPTKKKPPTSGKKVKNKVGSPVARSVAYKHSVPPSPLREDEYSSDEFDYSQEEDEPEIEEQKQPEQEEQKQEPEVPPSDTDTSAASQGSRVPLPWNLRRQLLTDILEAGGIRLFDYKSQQALSVLCSR
jgi:hypothetical protein